MGFVLCFGLFWKRDEVDWNPGRRIHRHLWGHQGEHRRVVRVADFWNQSGIYILYGDYGIFRIGRTFGSIGGRLQTHNRDYSEDQWDKFSWFGFRSVLQRRVNGVSQLGRRGEYRLARPNNSIRDSEAMLIRATNPRECHNTPTFTQHDQWEQIPLADVDHFLELV